MDNLRKHDETRLGQHRPGHSQPDYTPGIFKQGLRLVLVPAILTSASLIVLNCLWGNLSDLNLQQQHQSDMALELNLSFANAINFGRNLLNCCFDPTNKVENQARANHNKVAVREAMGKARDLLNQDPQNSEERQIFNQTIGALEAAIGQLDLLAPRLEQQKYSNNLQRLRDYSKLLNTALYITNSLTNFQEHSSKRLADTRKKTLLLLDYLQYSAVAAFVIGASITAILTFSFGKNIALRLRLLKNHALNFNALKDSDRQLDGQDELQYLDQTFFDCASELRASAEQRAMILQMIAHDVRSPLMASMICLEVFDKIVDDIAIHPAHGLAPVIEDEIRSVLGEIDQLQADKLIDCEDQNANKKENDSRGNYLAHSKIPVTLLQKCLGIGILTLAAQLIVLIFSLNQIGAARNLTLQENAQSQTTFEINQLLFDIYACHYGLANFLLSNQEKYAELTKTKMTSAREQISKLESEQKNLISDYLRLAKAEIARIDKLLHDSGTVSVSETLGALPAVLISSGQVNEQLQNALLNENRKLDQLRLQQKQYRDFVQLFALVAIPADIIGAAALLYFIASSMARRLETIAEMARSRKLSRCAPTEHDEIALIQLALERAIEELRTAQAARAELAENLSRSIRTPLLRARDKLKTLAACDLPTKAATNLKSSTDNINRVLTLIDQLLPLQNSEGKFQLEIKDTPINQLLQQIVDSLQSIASKNLLEIQWANMSSRRTFALDSDRIHQVFVNLISNAIKFSSPGSVIRLSAEDKLDGIVFVVQDEGQGMDHETAARAFEKFYRAPTQEHTGHGLGLAICRMIVEAHGGTISLQSQLGRGTTFTIILPD